MRLYSLRRGQNGSCCYFCFVYVIAVVVVRVIVVVVVTRVQVTRLVLLMLWGIKGISYLIIDLAVYLIIYNIS